MSVLTCRPDPWLGLPRPAPVAFQGGEPGVPGSRCSSSAKPSMKYSESRGDSEGNRRACIHSEACGEVNGKHDKRIHGENLSSHTREVLSLGLCGLTKRIKY